MRRPVLLAVSLSAALLPFLARAAPVTTPVPVSGSFSRVESRGDFDVEVREGTPASVTIVAEPGIAERIQVEVTGGALRLTRDRSAEPAKGAVVRVVLPEFKGLSVGGSGSGTAESGAAPRDVKLGVSGSGKLAWKGTAAELDVGVSGSGSLRAEGSSTKLSVGVSGSGEATLAGSTGPARVAVSGSGDVKLSGKADRIEIAVSGSGDVDAKGFPVREADVAIAGSGDVDLQLTGGTLNARIAGSGDVNWSGEAKLGSVATAGSGRVRQRG